MHSTLRKLTRLVSRQALPAEDAMRLRISAFVDGEAAAGEAEIVMRLLRDDRSLRSAWEEYVWIGDALRAARAVHPASRLHS